MLKLLMQTPAYDDLKQWGLTGILLVFIIEKMTACIITVVGKVKTSHTIEPRETTMAKMPTSDAPVVSSLCEARMQALEIYLKGLRELTDTKLDNMGKDIEMVKDTLKSLVVKLEEVLRAQNAK